MTAKPWYEEAPKGPNPFNWRKLSDVKAVPIKWLWKPYIPKGAVTLIAGDGGYGKSWMTCALAADLSQGRALPGQQAMEPQRVLMVSAEDGLGEVTRPKMDLLGANMDNIVCSDEGFTITPDTRAHLAEIITAFDAAVVFLDPLVVYMGGKVDMFRANETRDMMNILVEVAKHTHTAIVAVHHVRKSGEGSLQNKVMGSADIVNGVRSTLLVDITKAGQRFMAHAKSNWAANGPALAYKFGSQGFEWQGLFDEESEDKPRLSHTRRGESAKWVRDTLYAGAMPSGLFKEAYEAAGLAKSTMENIKPGLYESLHDGTRWITRLCPKVVEEMQRAEMPEPDPGPVLTGPLAEAKRRLADKGVL